MCASCQQAVELVSNFEYLSTFFFLQGAIQKLRGQDFEHFWLPPYLKVDIFYPKLGQKEALFDHLPTSSCPPSFWMTPNAKKSFDIKSCNLF